MVRIVDEIISYKMCAVKVPMQNCGITLMRVEGREKRA